MQAAVTNYNYNYNTTDRELLKMKSSETINFPIPPNCVPKLTPPKQTSNVVGEDQIPRAKPLTDSDFLAKFSKLYQLELVNSKK